jgi:hypothetical protein
MGARYFQSQTARFTRPDDPGFGDPFDPQSMNMYAYAYNNPLKFVDPTGHAGECPPGTGADFCTHTIDEAWEMAKQFALQSWLYFNQQLADAARRAGDMTQQSLQQANQWTRSRVAACGTNPYSAGCEELIGAGIEGLGMVAGGLTGGARRILGGLAPRAGESIRRVILSRGGKAINVNEVGHWADKTLAAAAEAAAAGDQTASKAIKIAKNAKRLGQKF